jgi:hypothetical protein
MFMSIKLLDIFIFPLVIAYKSFPICQERPPQPQVCTNILNQPQSHFRLYTGNQSCPLAYLTAVLLKSVCFSLSTHCSSALKVNQKVERTSSRYDGTPHTEAVENLHIKNQFYFQKFSSIMCSRRDTRFTIKT